MIPTETVREWLNELRETAAAQRHDGQKAKLVGALNRKLLHLEDYRRPTLGERASRSMLTIKDFFIGRDR